MYGIFSYKFAKKKNQAGKLAAISHMCGYFSPEKVTVGYPKVMGWDLGFSMLQTWVLNQK